mgnify:CR=1 FL=1
MGTKSTKYPVVNTETKTPWPKGGTGTGFNKATKVPEVKTAVVGEGD